MEPGGGGGGGGGKTKLCSAFARVGAGWTQVEGDVRGKVFSAWEATSAAEGDAASCWRRDLSESAPPRGFGRRPLSAFVPCANLKILLERDLSKERHELLKDQRLFRNKARKHYIETNKRRRALEEKWKEEEEKEQRLREQILLQRKLKHQEATEKFQRGHLPSSQRKRGVQRIPGPKLDDAVNQIQITVLPTSKVNGRATYRPSSATKNASFKWKHNSAKTDFDRVTQESTRANPDSDQLQFQQNLDEMQQQLQEQHFSSLQDFYQEVKEIAHSESICSVDSLEAAEPNESYSTPSEASSSSAQLDSSFHHSEGSQTKTKSFSDETHMTFSKNEHVNNWLINLNNSNIPTASPFRDILIKYNVVPSGEETRRPEQKSSVPSTYEQGMTERCSSDDNLTPAQNKDDECSLLKHPCLGTVNREDHLANDSPVHQISKAWITADSSPGALVLEEISELPQNKSSLAQASSQTAAAPVIFPTGQWSSTTTYNYNSCFLVNCTHEGKDAAKCTEDIGCVTGANTEQSFDHINDEALLFDEPCKGILDQPKGNREGKVHEAVLTVPHGDIRNNVCDISQQENYNATEIKGAKLPKSILKKESKYEPGSFRAVVVNRGIRFGNQPVSSVKDSIELAKTKGKDADVQRIYKKLRWFDEINRDVEANDDEKCSELSITEIIQALPQSPGSQIKATTSTTNLESISSDIVNFGSPENHQEKSQTYAKLAAAGSSEGDSGIPNPLISTGYHVAKQAWMAPRSEEIKPPPCNADPKNPKNNIRKGRTKIIKRPKSAKAPSTFIPKNRKGTIVRPQSASEASRVMKTQGKIMVPHPPCKPIPGKKTDENPADTTYQTVNLCSFHADIENNHFLNEHHPLLEGQDLSLDTTADLSSPSMACYSRMVMRPSYSILTYEPLTKAKCIANAAQSVASGNSFTKRSPLYSEKELCPHRTPTDEEITILWQGVHRALAQREGASGDSQHCATNNINSNHGDMQPTRHNVSHITIDGGNLMGNNNKSGARANGAFSSQPSSAVAMARRKPSNENSENKHKALLEQRRQMAASAGWKPSTVGQNTVKAMKGPYQCAHEPVQATGGISNSDEVSESTSQFLLAENLVNTSATEGEILTALDTAQLNKKAVVLNRAQRQGMSALSLEEYKVLQSLERINQRLQNVQGTINKHPSCTSILQTIPPLVASPSYVDIMSPIQKYRSISAETRALMQKRY